MDSEGKIYCDRKSMVAGMVMWQQELVVETVHILTDQKERWTKMVGRYTTSKTHPYPQPSRTVAAARGDHMYEHIEL